MPYGLKGGDTPAKDRKAEKVIKAIMREHPHLSKVSAIKIMKAQAARGHKR